MLTKYVPSHHHDYCVCIPIENSQPFSEPHATDRRRTLREVKGLPLFTQRGKASVHLTLNSLLLWNDLVNSPSAYSLPQNQPSLCPQTCLPNTHTPSVSFHCIPQETQPLPPGTQSPPRSSEPCLPFAPHLMLLHPRAPPTLPENPKSPRQLQLLSSSLFPGQGWFVSLIPLLKLLPIFPVSVEVWPHSILFVP